MVDAGSAHRTIAMFAGRGDDRLEALRYARVELLISGFVSFSSSPGHSGLSSSVASTRRTSAQAISFDPLPNSS